MVLAAAPTQRKPDRRTEAEELRMEVRAAGQDMVAIAQRIYSHLIDGDLRRIEYEAGRLSAIGIAYVRGDHR
jgi:hypothetical protein